MPGYKSHACASAPLTNKAVYAALNALWDEARSPGLVIGKFTAGAEAPAFLTDG